ncbi:MAG: type III-B CRISPR module RAMP protein Cmr6 [Oscillospiraceae bacterium]|nr:type III-B CRISPR module RAMP protein Cmr6 [Oscillospiraceae bacterium]
MKFQSKNMHYVFHREYFDGLELLLEKGAPTRTVEERNQAVFSFAFPKADLFAGLRELRNFRSFSLVTTYPGLLVGIGNPHDAKLDGAIKLGFSLDYVTGLPYIPGSSLKGMLRSRFPGKYGGEEKTDREILIGAYLGREDIDAEALEAEIFDGNDIFLGAFPTDWPDGMLSMEYITPHKRFQDPNPISMMKIKPNVCFEFCFLLSDGTISAARKCGLFRDLVMESGIGAKTNVGYGRMAEPEARPKPNRIGYDPQRYEYMNSIMQARAQRDATRKSRDASATQSRTPQRVALGKCPNCGAEIVSGNKFPSCANNCGFRPGRPRGYRKPVTDGEYRKLLNGESVLMRGFESQYGNYDALVRLKGTQPPQIDPKTGQTVRYGDYQVERQL